MPFGWLSAFLNNCISTNIHGHFESFLFFNQKITLVAGLVQAAEPIAVPSATAP
jgi:hypothetical protein